MELEGRSAVIAGGAGGLGGATARRLAAAGVGVVILDPNVTSAIALVTELGDRAAAVPGSSNDDGAVAAAIARARELGTFSIAVSATGVVTGVKAGSAAVTIAATDGSGITKVITITVISPTTEAPTTAPTEAPTTEPTPTTMPTTAPTEAPTTAPTNNPNPKTSDESIIVFVLIVAIAFTGGFIFLKKRAKYN